jgi:hypothetical protein
MSGTRSRAFVVGQCGLFSRMARKNNNTMLSGLKCCYEPSFIPSCVLLFTHWRCQQQYCNFFVSGVLANWAVFLKMSGIDPKVEYVPVHHELIGSPLLHDMRAEPGRPAALWFGRLLPGDDRNNTLNAWFPSLAWNKDDSLIIQKSLAVFHIHHVGDSPRGWNRGHLRCGVWPGPNPVVRA